MTVNKKTFLAASSLAMPAAALAVYLLTGPSPAKAFGCVCYYACQVYSEGSTLVVSPGICVTCAIDSGGCTWRGHQC